MESFYGLPGKGVAQPSNGHLWLANPKGSPEPVGAPLEGPGKAEGSAVAPLQTLQVPSGWLTNRWLQLELSWPGIPTWYFQQINRIPSKS